ncbi:HK97 family phage prohead protease [Salinicoccus roseus]|uniref:HK97 family phage prohead protease n=1 Tax=Salinicoccus roseus TaxID=45670 RepID=UPI001EF3E9E9|nr:HK97 family phage prohead protease [Salinicoccus roseus]MCG7331196.1 HK97 family phage prohead protease [Salinicoccus roseus]
MKATGYAIIFGTSDTEKMVYSRESFRKTDFTGCKAIDGKGRPYSSTAYGTLKFELDERGLKFTSEIPEVLSYGADTVENIQAGNIRGVGMIADTEGYTENGRFHVTKVRRLRSICINSEYTHGHSTIRLIESGKRASEMTPEEIRREKLKLKLQLID